MTAAKRPIAELVLVPVVHVRVVWMRVLDRLVDMNVRVRFLIARAIRVLMLMMLVVDVPVFVHNGRMAVQMSVIFVICSQTPAPMNSAAKSNVPVNGAPKATASAAPTKGASEK